MSDIKNIIPVEQDELLYSYLTRLALANGFHSLAMFVKYVFLNGEKPPTSFRPDANYYFGDFLSRTDAYEDRVDFYLKHSLYPVIAPLTSEYRQYRLLHNAFRRKPETHLLAKQDNTFRQFRYCPECAKKQLEEDGYMIFDRRHHIPGVTACPVHGCKLIGFTDTYKPVPEAIGDTEPAVPFETQYAEFAAKFMDLELQADYTAIKAAIKRRITENYDGKFQQFIKEFQEWIPASIFPNFNIKRFKKHLPTNPPDTRQETLLLTLMYLFPDPSEIQKFLPEQRHQELKFYDALGSDYDLFDRYRKTIVELEYKETSETFITNPYGFLIGWKAPSLDEGKSDAQKYKELVQNTLGNDYVLLSEYQRNNAPIEVEHRVCGRKYRIMPPMLLAGTRCRCEYETTTEQAAEAIRRKGPYTLIKFNGYKEDAQFRHDTCGRTFTMNYRVFLGCPKCPCSFTIRNEKDFKARLKEVVGDEYTLVSKFIGGHEKVDIRHNVCGRIQSYKTAVFLAGVTRCRSCHVEIKDEDFRRYVSTVTNGRYEITSHPRGERYLIKDTENGTELDLHKGRILSELTRPTPSPILPCDFREPQKIVSIADSLMNMLRKKYGPESLIAREDIQMEGFTYDQIGTQLQMLTIRKDLYHVGHSYYAFHEMPAEGLSERICTEKYILRNGHKIGFITGDSAAYAFGISDVKPELLSIVSNKAGQMHIRKKNWEGYEFMVAGTKAMITDENCDLLQVLDIIKYRYSRRWKNTFQVLAKYLRKKQIPYENFLPYLHFYHERVGKELKAIYEIQHL